MGKFQLLTREGEVEVAKRIEAGEREVEEEILKSPIMLDYVIRIGEQVEASDVDLREVFEETEEAEADEEKGPEADQAQMGREPTPEEIAGQMEMPLDKVQRALKIVKEPISLEMPTGDDDESSLGDFVEDGLAPSPVEAAIHTNLSEQTRKVLATLPPSRGANLAHALWDRRENRLHAPRGGQAIRGHA